MKHTYSLNNLKQSKNAHELQNFCVYPSDFPFQSGCISSKCSTKQIFGITSAKGFSNRKNSNFNLILTYISLSNYHTPPLPLYLPFHLHPHLNLLISSSYSFHSPLFSYPRNHKYPAYPMP